MADADSLSGCPCPAATGRLACVRVEGLTHPGVLRVCGCDGMGYHCAAGAYRSARVWVCDGMGYHCAAGAYRSAPGSACVTGKGIIAPQAPSGVPGYGCVTGRGIIAPQAPAFVIRGSWG